VTDLVLRNARLVYADGSILAGGLRAREGTIVEVFAGEPAAVNSGAEVLDANGKYVLPGAIDPHVQLYPAPEFAHYATETRSAAIGGVTTILKMHRDLDGYPVEAFHAEIAGAEGRAHIDFGFHLMLMSDEQIALIPDYAREFELTSFKALMAYKGEEGFKLGIQGIDDAQLLAAFSATASVGGVMLVHCENQELANQALERVRATDRDGLAAFADTRPPVVEAEAIKRATYLAGAAGCPLYVVHVTSRDGVESLIEARNAGANVFIETEAHYLTETCDSAAGNLLKVLPPVRASEHREALWRALESGELDAVGSDHVASMREQKQGTVWEARLGFPGIATILPALLSEGVNAGELTLSRVAEVTSTRPAQIFGLDRKGQLLPGRDADFVIVDLDLEQRVTAELLGSASDFSPYEGRTLRGWPITTVSRGVTVMRDGKLVGPEGHGRYLRRSPKEAT
jgi:dihydropyrimidinase